ncbi:hypothetical protein EZS27_031501 [termite gut metagenome]|uniref:Uncharacterized protein n=1 Tax=termite gut metagenome TaxID=433724 RepID=A0A5J4QBT5_9ZZZZ
MFVIVLIVNYKNNMFKLYLPSFYSLFFVELRFLGRWMKYSASKKPRCRIFQKKMNLLYHFQKDNTNLLLKVMALYAELASCGLTDGKKKERLKEGIDKLLNPKS